VVRSTQTPPSCPQRYSRSSCRSWLTSLATMIPTAMFLSVASRISFLMSASVTPESLFFVSTTMRGSSGAPLGSRNDKM